MPAHRHVLCRGGHPPCGLWPGELWHWHWLMLQLLLAANFVVLALDDPLCAADQVGVPGRPPSTPEPLLVPRESTGVLQPSQRVLDCR